MYLYDVIHGQGYRDANMISLTQIPKLEMSVELCTHVDCLTL